ncbi:MAG: hypothetical protein JWO80_1463, partial [Bryobacterales bacterium]|nr:hypothetical protein [Bryobacterales bacterium]
MCDQNERQVRRAARWVPREYLLTSIMPEFTEMKTWTERLGRSNLRAFTDEHKHFWLEQNASKASKWA